MLKKKKKELKKHTQTNTKELKGWQALEPVLIHI